MTELITASTAWEKSANSNFRRSEIMQGIYKVIEQACDKGIYHASVVASIDNDLDGISKLLKEIGYEVKISGDPFNVEIYVCWKNFIVANKAKA